MRARLTLLLAFTLLLAACASPGSRPPGSLEWSQHRAQLAILDHWTASGKLSLRTADQAESANMVWQQQAGTSQLSLSGPMGLNATTISSDGQQMQIDRGDEQLSFDISTPDAVRRNTGWDLPLNALPFWLKGLPAPAMEVQALELNPSSDLLHKLQQDEWQVLYQDYQDFHGYTLPTRLRIQRGDTAVKIILRNWQAESS